MQTLNRRCHEVGRMKFVIGYELLEALWCKLIAIGQYLQNYFSSRAQRGTLMRGLAIAIELVQGRPH